jgi:hypothetical protein
MRKRRNDLVLAIGLAGLLASAESGRAHGGRSADVRAVLGPLPAALAGMRIEVHETIAPQLVLANPTQRVVEVVDDRGRPFLRIGPDGVEGDTAAPAWYRTYAPGTVVPASAVRSAAPRWLRARSEPSFGWFEPRIDASKIEVPHAVIDAGVAADVGRWEIPLHVDGSPVTLAGAFRYEPPPSRAYGARLTSPSEIAPGVRVTLLPGRHPGLLLENTSARPVTVVGDRGEPFLRIGPAGVEANVRSDTWQRSGRAGSTARVLTSIPAEPDWVRVATAPRYGWIEPRAAAPTSTRAAGGDRWQVPLQIGAERVLVSGERRIIEASR